MTNQFVDFQFFLMGIILLSNTQYMHFALMDIKFNKRNNRAFVHKCLLYSLYTMFVAITFVLKLLWFDLSKVVDANVLILLYIACIFFMLITLIVFVLFKRSLKSNFCVMDMCIIIGMIIVGCYILNLINNRVYFFLIFVHYSGVTISFFYNIVILKKIKMNYGIYFIFASYVVLAFVNGLIRYIPFDLLVTINMALNTFIIYGLYLFFAQYYVEELEKTYSDVVAHVGKLEKLNRKISMMAYRDHLTNIPNEMAFVQFLEESDENLGILMINIRNFSSFNQILGFSQGNALLKKVAEQLAPFANEPNKLFKLYNDKFVLAMPGVDFDVLMDYAKCIHENYHTETIMNFKLEVGVGITQYKLSEHKELTPSAIIAALETAISRSKNCENRTYYLPMSNYLSEKTNLNLEYHLREAIENHQIEVYYQPQVNAKSKMVCSYEALARWQHEGAFITPDIFIPLAESSGLITRLTYQIIESVFQSVHQTKWNARKKISINLSSIQLVESGLTTYLSDCLKTYPISPKEIVFEITETALLYDLMKVEDTIKRLKALAFEISLDDFGTGYSSLNRFSKLNFDEVKFDRFFIEGLEKDEKLKVVFNKTLELFNTLDMRIVVEGVETKAQEVILDAYEIDHYQGYYYGRPEPLSFYLKHQSFDVK